MKASNFFFFFLNVARHRHITTHIPKNKYSFLLLLNMSPSCPYTSFITYNSPWISSFSLFMTLPLHWRWVLISNVNKAALTVLECIRSNLTFLNQMLFQFIFWNTAVLCKDSVEIKRGERISMFSSGSRMAKISHILIQFSIGEISVRRKTSLSGGGKFLKWIGGM